MVIKKVWQLLPVFIVISIIVYFEWKSRREREILFKSSLNNKIMKVKHNWTVARSYDYEVDNGVIITLLNDYSLLVGDSIIKEGNSSRFEVYRKLNGDYEFFTTFNVSK